MKMSGDAGRDSRIRAGSQSREAAAQAEERGVQHHAGEQRARRAATGAIGARGTIRRMAEARAWRRTR